MTRSPQGVAEEMAALVVRLDGLLDAHLTESKALAEYEREYRIGKAQSWLRVLGEEAVKQAAHREAWVDADTADLRYKRDLADGVARSAGLAIRSVQQQISSLQSEMSAYRAEAELAGKGPR